MRKAASLAREVPNPILKARKYEAALASGLGTYRDVARAFGVTREEVCQYVALLRRLPAELVHAVENESRPEILRTMSYRRLLARARKLHAARSG